MAESNREEDNKPKLKLSILDRLLLKLPKLSLRSFPEYFHGVFWAVGIPLFIVLGTLFILVVLVYVPFPMNYLFAAAVPAFVILYFSKTMVERFIDWYNATFAKPMEWNVDKSSQEYFDLLEKQKAKREGKSS
jgi:hypothetical protein